MPPGAIPYKKSRLQRQSQTGGSAILNAPIGRLKSAFKLIVDAEGPISIKSAKYRILDAWDSRKGSKINNYLNLAISQAVREKSFNIQGDFLWPIGMVVPPLRIHLPGQPVRAIDEIAPEEIMAAIRACILSALGIFREDLIRETCRLFGLNATRENTIYVEKTIKYMVSKKFLSLDKDKITKGEKFL